MIGDITIVIVEIRGDKCRVGIEAPKDVPVHRREVYDAIKRSQAADGAVVATGEVNPEQAIGRTKRPVFQVENAVIQVPMPIKPELKWGSNVKECNDEDETLDTTDEGGVS